mmetsp:Transcript_6028/g.18908  ORF Transcript_6028/g.18908 Transcript_6028/m.18908 type:complete len:86 (-) Transcript_6028:1244-1501(-)
MPQPMPPSKDLPPIPSHRHFELAIVYPPNVCRQAPLLNEEIPVTSSGCHGAELGAMCQVASFPPFATHVLRLVGLTGGASDLDYD